MIQGRMDASKRQNMQAGLWVVATPIGNLADLTDRARQALAECSALLCEDTRRTSKLVASLGLQPRLERFDAHSGPGVVSRLIERMLEGERLALVTDAGTPGISDPGSALVAAAHAAGIPVTPIPGASAVVALLSAAGFEETAFAFRGFFPRKEVERQAEVARCASSAVARVFVWFESPERVTDALQSIAVASSEARVAAAKELTKVHERIFTGTSSEVAARVSEEIAREGARGEWVLAARFPALDDGDEAASEESSLSASWKLALRCLLDCGVSPSEAAKSVSRNFEAPRKSVYDEALRLAGRKD